MIWRTLLLGFIGLSSSLSTTGAALAQPGNADAAKLRVLIVDGQNNHDWKTTTPLLRKALESSGRFVVEVATSPPSGGDMSGFRPRFADYDVVVGNYNGDRWPAATERDFEAYVTGGGGFVAVHAANNAFPDWPAYNRMIGVGGWSGRTEKSGPYVYVNDAGSLTRDPSPGSGGHHGPQHEFQIRVRDPDHPIMRGLPPLWVHAKDELYDSLRGPAEDLHVLATAYSSPEYEGTGRHEPMLMTLEYGNGRVFHTVLGHADYSMNCVGFLTTLQRGTEWAATGEVTLPGPDDFPTADEPRSRD
jgi:type 1 glutamine amidotransferase